MIDIENVVYTTVYDALIAAFPNIQVSGDSQEQFASFPAVTIEELNNHTLERTLDEQLHEHHARLTYNIEVYSDRQRGRKGECRKIFDVIDRAMQGMKFIRGDLFRVPTIDRTIYRMYGRYYAIVEEGEPDGNGNTVYQMYRY